MLAALLGILYAYLSVYIISIGAAIAVPANILAPIAKVPPTFAFALVDMITTALPLIMVYFLFAFIVKYFNSNKHYLPFLVLLAPFCFQHIFFFINIGQSQNWLFTIGTIMPRYIVIVFFALYVAKKAANQAKA
ncbi:hypothetical protein FGD67_18325 [Colwellia sp. M166]|uniref:hypothetical protein n=1 Tax=Colwellia sp. M166 TaxID=2583805 RepID=UPI00211E7ACD|nr:hypothetical protein [Colwellia sp. M166]UUO24948.1 hypothetical protein FGD67_18325 [Colwellia sp. M166]